MSEDLRELLTLLVQAGKVAERLLQSSSAPVVAAPPEVPAPAPSPPPLTEVPPHKPPLTIPPNFRIGSYSSFTDRTPTMTRWFTSHARDMLMERHGVDEHVVYQTLQHVYRLICNKQALFLYAKDDGRIWAVHFFGRVAAVVMDNADAVILSFLPPEALENDQVKASPSLRAQLKQYQRDAARRRQLRTADRVG